MKLLIPASCPGTLGSQPLFLAASGGHAECVKLLIPESAIEDIQSTALVNAVRAKSPECVRLVMQAAGPNPKGFVDAVLMGVQQKNTACLCVLVSEHAPAKAPLWPPRDALAAFHRHRKLNAALCSSARNGLREAAQAVVGLATPHGIFLAADAALLNGHLAIAQDMINLIPKNKLRSLRKSALAGGAHCSDFLDSLIEREALGSAIAPPSAAPVSSHRKSRL